MTTNIPTLGATQTAAGVTWTAAEHVHTCEPIPRPRGVLWRAGPGLRIEQHCLGGCPHPFNSGAAYSRTFEEAADRAVLARRREIEKARQLLADHEALPPLVRAAIEKGA